MIIDKLNLNEQQLEAVKAVDGPVIVFAGAGTGKTKTLTSRIAYMIGDVGIKPENILAITFTNKATNEMRERIHLYCGEQSNKVNISTIHALCPKILRQTIHVLGYKNNFEIIDEEDANRVVNEIYKELDISRKFLSPKYAYHSISNYKNGVAELMDPVTTIYKKYEEKLFEQNQVDFDDLLLLTERVLSENEDYLKYYQNKFKYILVDEFQDTNIIQYNIIKMLCNDGNLFVVGDDDQSIYAFRGANVLNMNQFSVDYPNAKKVLLTHNYRSTNIILKGSNNLIGHNIYRQQKELQSDKDGLPSDIIIHNTEYFEDEPRFVAQEIHSLVRKGYKYSDIAILYRNNVISRNFEKSFIENGIPYIIFGGFQFLRRKEIKDMVSYLKFIVDPENLFHFKRIINLQSRGIGDKTIEKLLDYKTKNNCSLFEAIEIFNSTNPSTKTQALMDFKNEMTSLIEKVNKLTLPEFYEELLEVTKYVEFLEKEEIDEVFQERHDNIREFKSILVTLEQNPEVIGLTSVEKLNFGFDNIILDESAGTKYSEDGVIMSTVHSVKGLEFKVVFIVAMEEGIFPTLKEDSGIEEERRIAYVAVTRAKEKLYMTYVNRRLIYGRVVLNQQSRFITEFVSIEDWKEKMDEAELQIDTTPIKTGDKINHATFGKGLVIADQGAIIQVLFEKDHSLKKLMKDHPSIKKIK